MGFSWALGWQAIRLGMLVFRSGGLELVFKCRLVWDRGF